MKKEFPVYATFCLAQPMPLNLSEADEIIKMLEANAAKFKRRMQAEIYLALYDPA